jgi:hypothetical protein
MRSLTTGEATVVRSLLASNRLSQREQIRRSEVPSRTFERVRRRAFSEGWVFYRYVPDPVRVGRPFVRLTLAQPFADRLRDVEEHWKANQECVLLWRWPETLFAVFMSGTATPKAGPGSLDPNTFRGGFEVNVDSRCPHLPVFFDFEAVWSRFSNLPGILEYPHPLTSMAGRSASPLGSIREERAFAGMLRRPFQPRESVAPFRLSSVFLPPSQQRLLRSGAIEYRVFLEPARVPPYQNRALERVAFVHGEFLRGASPAALFRRLAAMQVFPFLFAANESEVLLGTMSQAAPVPRAPGPRPAVLTNLQEFLRLIAITREPVAAMSVLVNHRYDRLVESLT